MGHTFLFCKGEIEMINCPECSHQISETAKTCPNCGCNVKQAQKKKRQQQAIEQWNKMSPEEQTKSLAISLVVIVVIVALLFGISQCDDGSCERCSKEGVYEIGGDKYCEKHYLDVMGELIEWDGN